MSNTTNGIKIAFTTLNKYISLLFVIPLSNVYCANTTKLKHLATNKQ